MPHARCCYCGKDIPSTRRRYRASDDQLLSSAAWRVSRDLPVLQHALHVCSTHSRRPPSEHSLSPTRAKVLQHVSRGDDDSSRARCMTREDCCSTFALTPVLPRGVQHDTPRRALSDITNIPRL